MEFEPKEPSKTKRYCVVPGCDSQTKKRRDLIFHRFPKENEKTVVSLVSSSGNSELLPRREAWFHRIQIQNRKSDDLFVCSLHFSKDDYICPNINFDKKKTLKRNAVPSLNLSKEAEALDEIDSAFPLVSDHFCIDANERMEAAFALLTFSGQTLNESIECTSSSNQEKVDESNVNVSSCSTSHNNEVPHVLESAGLPTEFKEFGLQVCSGDFKRNFCHIIDTDKKLRTLTGLPNLEVLDFLVEECGKHPNIKKSITLSLRERILLTFFKLKHNLWNSVLTLLFNDMTEATCGNYIHDMLPILSSVLSPNIRWISDDENRRNMPLCFQDFSDVVCVLDCTEIAVQKPKCLCCRARVYSHYKGTNTVKFLAGVSPGGLFTFLSAAYGGRSSDKGIFNHEQFIKNLKTGDAIMVDKGFLIESECAANGVRLVRPCFLGRKKKQFSPSESFLNADVARARVHVERMFQRVKQFKILHEQLPCNLLHQVENIFTIICAIVNLSPPILSIDRY